MIRLNKWVIVMGLSFSPTILGILINELSSNVSLSGLFMYSISFLFYIYWIYAGYKMRSVFRFDAKVLVLTHAIGILSLFMMGYQIGVHGHFLPNAIGLMPQFYFIPGIGLLARIDVFGVLGDIVKLSSAALILMVICFYGGTRLAVKFLSK